MAIEILVAVSIISVSILAAMAVSQKSIQVSRHAFHFTQAAFLLEEGAEAMRIVRDNSWTGISSLNAGTDYYLVFSDGTWALSGTPNALGVFTRKINVENVSRDDITKDISGVGTGDSGTKLIIITVSWPEGGETISKTLQYYLMDVFS